MVDKIGDEIDRVEIKIKVHTVCTYLHMRIYVLCLMNICCVCVFCAG